MTSKRKSKGDKAEKELKKQKIDEFEGLDLSQYDDLELPPASTFEGQVLICGNTNWDLSGRNNVPKGKKDKGGAQLWGPNILSPLKDVKIRTVVSSCIASHNVAISTEGRVYTWGRNDRGQLGMGDERRRDHPVTPPELEDLAIVEAACGKNHTLFITEKGDCYSAGENKMGQLGVGGEGNNFTSPVKIDYKGPPICKVAAGADFSMFVNIDGNVYSAGCPEYGQLGHNTDGKFFVTSNKVGWHLETRPTRVPLFIDKSRDGSIIPVPDVNIIDIKCGVNHTIALDKNGSVYTWGFGGYGRLGHACPKDEYVPRLVTIFSTPKRGADRINAGGTYCMATDVLGTLYLWGQTKSTGEATMYPKPYADLCGWAIRSIGCSNKSFLVAADDQCICCGSSPTYGELGLGNEGPKSASRATEIKAFKNNGIYIQQVTCGIQHSLFIAKTESDEDKENVEKLPVYTPPEDD